MRLKAYWREKGFRRKCAGFGILLPSFAVLLLQGCAERQIRVQPWGTAVAVRPRIPAAGPGYKPEAPEPFIPDLSWDLPAPPSGLNINRQPLRPHVLAPPPVESAEISKPATPSLEPQLSAQEIAAAQQQMNESLAVVRRNLDVAKGHALNPTQADLAAKVTSFLQESKQAVRDGDWTRARNLAKKAQVLSEELAASL